MIVEINQSDAAAHRPAILEGHDGQRPNRFLIKESTPCGPNWPKAVRQPWQCFSIGRATDNHIEVASALVSRHHAVLMRSEDQFFVVDLGSSNGTRVDGVLAEPRKRVPLNFGSELRLGQGASFTLTW